MNILALSWRGIGHPNAGGAETVIHEYNKGWVRAGHQVTLFTSSYKGAKKTEVVDGVEIIRLGGEVCGVHLRAFLWYFFGKHKKFDLVIDNFHGIPFFTPLYMKIKKTAFIHEVTKEVWKLNPWPKPFNLIPYFIGANFEPLIFKFFYKNTAFITVSESTKKELIEWNISEKNITVIHNGVNFIKYNRLPKKEDKKTIIFLGALTKDKGIEDAVETFSLISKEEKDWQFWIVGRGESNYLKEIHEKITKLGIKGKIKFWGFVDEKKKFELLARAHVLLNPSVREGWGLVVIEAARVGTPTVSYNVPGLRDSIINGRTGLICKDNRIEELALNINKLLTDKILYQKFSKEVKPWGKKFTWSESIQKSLILLKKLENK